MYLISTIEHSGTHSLIKTLGLEGVPAEHCRPEVVEWAKSGKYEVITAYRNPYSVAASWHNRKLFPLGWESEIEWVEQWECWLEIAKVATIYKTEDLPVKLNQWHKDTHGLHKALSENDMNHYFKFVPESYVQINIPSIIKERAISWQ